MLTRTMIQVQMHEISTARMYKWISVSVMLAIALYQIALTAWSPTAGEAHSMILRDSGLLFGLLTVLFLSISLSQPLLRLLSKLSEGVSAKLIGNTYFVVGGVCFFLSLIL